MIRAMADERITPSRDSQESRRRAKRRAATKSVRVAALSAMRHVSGTGMRGVRVVGGLPGFATAMIDVGTFESEQPSRPGVSVRRWSFEEPARELELVPGSDVVPALGGVRTTLSLLDITAPGYSLRHGHLVDPHRRVIYETEVVPSFPFSRIALMPLEKPSRVEGSVACLCQAANYGHWNLLALPLVAHYRRALGGDPDYYYVGSKVSSWQLESLQMLGIPEARLVRGPVTADRLLVAIADRSGGFDTDFLLYADTALRQDAQPAARATRRLLVSRAGASQRRLVNEAECMDALGSAFGVELVAVENLSLADEMALFGEAELVLGANGAGLTNAIFSPSGATLIELTSASIWVSQIAQIAAAKGLRYGLVRGQPTGLRFGVPAAQHDFAIDIDRVVGIVGAALG